MVTSNSADPLGASWLVHRIDATARGLVRHWLLLFNLCFGIWVIVPWLAPVFMHLGWDWPARLIYWFYGFFCHQLPERSWFLFGQHFTPTMAEIQRQSGAGTNFWELRQFIGNPEMGWKVAWSDRMVSLYGGFLLFSISYGLVRRFWPGWRGLHWHISLWLLLPIFIDGITHSISDLSGVGLGFRDTNAWLATLTAHWLSPAFYAGDTWGSFNSLARLVSGLLAAGAIAVWLWPRADRLFKKV